VAGVGGAVSDLADRLRGLLTSEPVTEKKMFGGLTFMYEGNLLCGVTKKGDFMARIGKALEAEARAALPGGRDMDFTGRKMGGMLFVADHVIATDEGLSAWVEMCLRHARMLPPK